jgi:hypothetical protein
MRVTQPPRHRWRWRTCLHRLDPAALERQRVESTYQPQDCRSNAADQDDDSNRLPTVDGVVDNAPTATSGQPAAVLRTTAIAGAATQATVSTPSRSGWLNRPAPYGTVPAGTTQSTGCAVMLAITSKSAS